MIFKFTFSMWHFNNASLNMVYEIPCGVVHNSVTTRQPFFKPLIGLVVSVLSRHNNPDDSYKYKQINIRNYIIINNNGQHGFWSWKKKYKNK